MSDKELERCINVVGKFILPIEEKFTGLGLPTVFSWLACRSKSGVITTGTMGTGKTITVELVAELFRQSEQADYILDLVEFKKTDWKVKFPPYATEKWFHFSVPEISVMPEYSQKMFIPIVNVLVSDGKMEYIYDYAAIEEGGGQIILENCDASYLIASQPPKTHHLINDETFRTLGNDRCWNIMLINQLRGMENAVIGDVKACIQPLNLRSGVYTHLYQKFRTLGRKKPMPTFSVDIKTVKSDDFITAYYPSYYVKFDNGKGKTPVDNVVNSTIDLKEFEKIIRNQYSVDRRYAQINSILKEWGAFLNAKKIQQVHVDLFCSLFGFYIWLFNSLTVGSVEQSIDFKYGGGELVCKMSSMMAKGIQISQDRLRQEFNTDDTDIVYHLNELMKISIIKEREIKVKQKKKLPRAKREKSARAIRKQTKFLQSAGLVKKRYATDKDVKNNGDLKRREIIYEFSDDINDFFTLYASILDGIFSSKLRAKNSQLNRFLNGTGIKILEKKEVV